jgi:hypothetical protein
MYRLLKYTFKPMLTPLILLIVISTSMFGSSLSVPIYYTTSVSFGYDSNIFKLSTEEMDNATYEPLILSDSETFDSAIIRPELKIKYNPVLFGNHETKVVAIAKQKIYTSSQSKGYTSYSISINQHLGRYKWLKIRYALIPNFYLRMYKDKDLINDIPVECDFSSENLSIDFSFPIIKKTWANISILNSHLFYNENFTEFDVDIYDYRVKLSTSLFRQFHAKVWFIYGEAENISFDTNYISTQDNRAYTHSLLGGGVKYQYSQTYAISGSATIDNRFYLSEVEDDPLHSGREHIDFTIKLSNSFKLNQNLILDISSKFRQKMTDSEFNWVENLKNYNKFEVWVTFKYNSYMDLFY